VRCGLCDPPRDANPHTAAARGGGADRTISVDGNLIVFGGLRRAGAQRRAKAAEKVRGHCSRLTIKKAPALLTLAAAAAAAVDGDEQVTVLV
jgi:hypothetical protein